MSAMPMRPLLAAALAGLLAACATGPSQGEAARKAAYAAAAGAPVKSFRFYNPLWSWEALGADQVAIYTRPREAWLLDVPGCTQLPFTNVIGLTSNLHEVSVRFDRVLTDRNTFPCYITRIRPVDVGRLKEVQREQRKVEERPRPADGAPGG